MSHVMIGGQPSLLAHPHAPLNWWRPWAFPTPGRLPTGSCTFCPQLSCCRTACGQQSLPLPPHTTCSPTCSCPHLTAPGLPENPSAPWGASLHSLAPASPRGSHPIPRPPPAPEQLNMTSVCTVPEGSAMSLAELNSGSEPLGKSCPSCMKVPGTCSSPRNSLPPPWGLCLCHHW